MEDRRAPRPSHAMPPERVEARRLFRQGATISELAERYGMTWAETREQVAARH